MTNRPSASAYAKHGQKFHEDYDPELGDGSGATMTAQVRDCATIHFSTRTLPPSQRLPALQAHFERIVRLDIDAEPGPSIDMTVQAAPGFRRVRMVSPLTARLARRRQMLTDGDDAVCLMIKTGGQLALNQCRQEGMPGTGDGVLLLYREPASLQCADMTYLAVRVPFEALAPIANVEAAAARCIPRDTEALALLRAYLASLPERIASPQLGQLSAAHIYDLIALAIGATDEGRQRAEQRGIRAARLDAIKAELIRNKRLSLDHLAARQGITPRYVQMLFEEAGTTFSDFALEQRLDAARNMLTGPRYARWSVASIALEAGFNDLSYFNRCFKRRYGMTPSDMRGGNQA